MTSQAGAAMQGAQGAESPKFPSKPEVEVESGPDLFDNLIEQAKDQLLGLSGAVTEDPARIARGHALATLALAMTTASLLSMMRESERRDDEES